MTTALIIALAVNAAAFLLMVLAERRRAKRHREKMNELEYTGKVYTTQMLRLSQQLRNTNAKLAELQKKYNVSKPQDNGGLGD